jgi:hypothetical protein
LKQITALFLALVAAIALVAFTPTPAHACWDIYFIHGDCVCGYTWQGSLRDCQTGMFQGRQYCSGDFGCNSVKNQVTGKVTCKVDPKNTHHIIVWSSRDPLRDRNLNPKQ